MAYTLEFNEDIYIIYLLEDSTLKPSVTIKPSNAEYVLVSSNPELVTVSDDGKSVKANYIDAMVTLTAMSGDLIDTALIYVYPERDYEPPDVPDELFHVRFDTFGWDSIPTQDIESNGLVTRPPYITYQNYGLGEWYTDKELTNVYDFSTPVTESFTLYAGWVETKTPIFTYGAVQENGGVLVTGIKYPLVEYGPIEIPEQNENGVPFVGIANAAFYKFDSTGARIDIKITSLTIPASIKQIGESAFQNCNYLTEIIFKGDGLEKIGINAFKNCAVLETLVIPQSANEISEGAFYGCAKFAPEIPLSVTVLDQDAYRGTAIVSLDLANVVYIHARSFKDCTKLDTISDPDMSKLQKIESDAFTGSSWINRKRVEVIGDSLNENKGMIFLGDVLLLCVKDPNSTHTSITVKIPENIKYIAGGAFPDTINNGFIKFSSETPPKIEAYAISTSVNLALVIPESDNVQATYQAYYTGITLTALRPKIVYKKVIDGLTMYVSNVPTTSNYYIYIQSYEPEETSKVFNLRKLLFDNFNSNVTIRKIKYGAFDPLSRDYGDLDTIILPPKILSMESNAFNGFSKLVLYIYGTEEEYGSHLPDSVQLFPGFIYGATSAVTIYVPNRNSGSSALVDIYREKWKSYVKSTSIKAEDLPTEWL
ncbi:MAG: leucine-rich repeat protein [Christensenellaceae bacterium]|nr:leucine-rich repeat protein [Christensenellaceae bacterium]